MLPRQASRITVVACADGDAAWSGGLWRDPSCQIVGDAASPSDAVVLAYRVRPRVVVLDGHGRDVDEVTTAVCAMRRAGTAVDVVLVSPRRDEAWVRATLEAGARGYLLSIDAADVGRAVRAVASGGAYFSPVVADLVRRGYLRSVGVPIDEILGRLDDAERSVLWWLVRGLSSGEIGAELALTADVVDACRRRIVAALA